MKLSGLRPWAENRMVMDLARNLDRILISGGGRHGREPNATINLTTAASFEVFADEVRSGWSHVLFLPQYREPLRLRILADFVRRSTRLPGPGWAAEMDRSRVLRSARWRIRPAFIGMEAGRPGRGPMVRARRRDGRKCPHTTSLAGSGT